jgi:hypothetical protein
MAELSCESVERYLQKLKGREVRVLRLVPLPEDEEPKAIKFWGYGSPVRIDCQELGEQNHRLVLHTMRPGPFGHEHMADRAQVLIWSNQAFGHLPRHVAALDVGGFTSNGELVSAGEIEEFFLITEYAEGRGYFRDLEQLRDGAALQQIDLDRADALCDYLVDIHSIRGDDAGLYTRKIRELIGHGECIMGIADSYPAHPLITAEKLKRIEHFCLDWRWRLKGLAHRLRQVHGDFHPWNILFRCGIDFSVLDRSRGEYGDAADDVSSLTMNYVFFSLQRYGRLEADFEMLFLRFWKHYLEKTGDQEILRVIAPFFAFRALVMASPVWYPNLREETRSKLLSFIFSVLESGAFDPSQVNRYCGI